jgi:hypothetical protein
MAVILIIVLAVIMLALLRGRKKPGKPCRKCRGQKVVSRRRWFHKRCLERCTRCDGTGKEVPLLARLLEGSARRKARKRRGGRSLWRRFWAGPAGR